MSRPLPPPPPNSSPEQIPLPRESRFHRPRRPFSVWGLLIGILLGLIGGLVYAWQIAPVREFDTSPNQLRRDDKANYVVAIALRFAQDSDLTTAFNALTELGLGADPFQEVADIACELASSGYVDSTAGIRALRTLKTFYQLQGKTGCADVLIDEATPVPMVTVFVPTNTPTLVPPPSKTPTPENNFATPTPSGIQVVPTTRPRQLYEGQILNTFCSVELSGIIEVRVLDFNGDEIAAQQVRVRWNGGEDEFVTGLKPERGLGYADFQMEAGLNYTIDMPQQSDPITQPLVADGCTTTDGETAITSYRVVFSQSG
jgi:hypothetical protein